MTSAKTIGANGISCGQMVGPFHGTAISSMTWSTRGGTTGRAWTMGATPRKRLRVGV